MKKFLIILFAIGSSFLFSGICLGAANFSKTFVGYVNNVPLKLQLTNNNDQLNGSFAYKNNFENSYIPDYKYIFGKAENDVITLNTNAGEKTNVSFEGKLLVSPAKNGMTHYELKGIWQDKMHLINQAVELKQLDLNSDINNPIVTQLQTSKSDKNFYNTSVSYPLFTGKNLTPEELHINAAITSFISKRVIAFEKSTIESNEQNNYKGLDSDANAFEINSMVTNSHPGLLSIRFMIFESNYRAAHPHTDYASLNFNTKSGEVISLADLFKPGSDYLKVISNMIRLELVKKLYPNVKVINLKDPDIEWIYEGTKPNADNFRVWNVYEDNLMITLPAYQVAAYVYGVQTIMIPFSKLKTILKPDGIISGRIA